MLTDMGAMRLASIFLLKTLPLMGATRLASVFSVVLFRGQRCSYYLVEFVLPSFLYPDAGRVAPIRASVGCLSLSQNGIIRQHKTQAQNASTNGGDASRVGKRCSYYIAEDVLPCFLCPDARRVAPIRASV